jgi:transposase
MANIKKSRFRYNTQTMIVAVDIGKSKNSVRFRDLEGNDSNPYEFSNSRVGYDKFLGLIKWHKARYDAKRVVVGFESTGSYGLPLAHFLDKHNIITYMVNPVHTKRVKEIRDNSPRKTDQKDPCVIADIMQLGCTLSVIIPKGAAADLRCLVQARERAIEMNNSCHSRMHELVFQIFPEFHCHIKSLSSKTALYLFEHYTLPEALAKLSLDELSTILRKASRGRFSTEKAAELLGAAQNHCGIAHGTSIIALEIRQLVQLIKNTQCFIADLEAQIKETLKSVPSSQTILSIKGIGPVTTATILGETAAFEGFTHAAEIEKLAGLNLYEISSGKRKGQRHISKRGRALLRKMLYFAAINVVKKQGAYHDKYQEYLKRGMPKNKALVAIARKLVRVIFAIVRDNSEFDATYEQNKVYKKAA